MGSQLLGLSCLRISSSRMQAPLDPHGRASTAQAGGLLMEPSWDGDNPATDHPATGSAQPHSRAMAPPWENQESRCVPVEFPWPGHEACTQPVRLLARLTNWLETARTTASIRRWMQLRCIQADRLQIRTLIDGELICQRLQILPAGSPAMQ